MDKEKVGGCICSDCRNLKAVIDEESGETDYECRYGYPSEGCRECNEDQCAVQCPNFIEDSEFEGRLVKCGSCGKEMLQAAENGEDGEVYCINCYLERN